jgi:hypothetical protein
LRVVGTLGTLKKGETDGLGSRVSSACSSVAAGWVLV